MAQYTISNIISVWVVGQTERKCQRTNGLGLRAMQLALLVSPVVALLLVSTYSIAAPYHFLTTPVSDSQINASMV